jgi:hypothetical protein
MRPISRERFGAVMDRLVASGLQYLDFALAVLAAAKIDHLFLMIDQLEDHCAAAQWPKLNPALP